MSLEENEENNNDNKLKKDNALPELAASIISSLSEGMKPVVSPLAYSNMLETSRKITGLGSVVMPNPAQIAGALKINGSMAETFNMVSMSTKSITVANMTSGVLEAMKTAGKVSDLLKYQLNMTQILQNTQSSAKLIAGCSELFSKQWVNAINGIQKLDAPSLAAMRLLPQYRNEKLPRGSKQVMKALTRNAAEELAKTEDIIVDPEDGTFYHEEAPEQKITANQITVVASSLELFETIGFDELLSFESKLSNEFIEHLRCSVENEEGKVVHEYLLPNFVATCCKKLGIDGIRYKSSKSQDYNCIVLWKDDYFEFVDGSREIIEIDRDRGD